MHTVEQIIDAFGYAKLAAALEIPAGTVSAWKAPSRRSIPSEYWQAIVRVAEAEGKADINLEALAAIHARHAPSPSEQESAA